MIKNRREKGEGTVKKRRLLTRFTNFGGCWVGIVGVVLLLGLPAWGAESASTVGTAPDLLYPQYEQVRVLASLKGVEWLKIIRERISPLTHDRGNRWPLVLIAGVGFKALPAEDIRMLLARGITQHLDLNEASLPAAHALQEAGAPIVLTTGVGGSWPYTLEPDKSQWAHQYPEELQVAPHWRDLPSPTRFSGWAIASAELRKTLSRFREEKIIVDAIFLDYENQPRPADYFAAILSPSTRALLPPEVVANQEAFQRYCRQLWVQLLSAYIAGPAREIFPKVAITNWTVSFSTPEKPILGWDGHPYPPIGVSLFTASNPVAYGLDTAFRLLWKKEYRLDQEHVDQFYLHILLRQVSVDSENRQRLAPYVDAFPWVGRWVPEHPKEKIPMMSRERYREALRHIWLRGTDGMQVFNPGILSDVSKVEIAIEEVQDAVAVYDEMLAYQDFLAKGTVIQFRYPEVQEDGPLWSGLRLEDEAIVRVFWQGDTIGQLEIEPWPGSKVTLHSPTRGATFRLRHDKKTNTVTVVGVGP